MRAFLRMFDQDYEAPRFAASIMSLGLLAATGIYGTWHGGLVPTVVEAVTARSGFAVAAVKVSGNVETSEIDVFEAIGLNGYTALVGLDVDAARTRIEGLPWVKSVTVRKIYPDTLQVRMEERTAFAVWQHDGQLTLIEPDGKPIAPYVGGRHAKLPLVVGVGAPERAADFVKRLADYPEIASHAVGYIRVGERRWDVRLSNGVTIRLPERDEASALSEVAALDREQGLLSRDIVAVDMRLTDRISVQMSPGAAEDHQAAMKAIIARKAKERQT